MAERGAGRPRWAAPTGSRRRRRRWRPASCPAPTDGADQERVERAAARHVKAPDERVGRAGVLVGRRRAGPGQLPRASSRPTPPGPASVVRRVLAGARARPTRSTRSSCSPTARRIRIDAGADRPAVGPRRSSRRPSTPRRSAIDAGHAARHATSAPARATRAATPTSASGPATTPATPGCAANLTADARPPAAARGRRPRGPPLRAAQPAGAQLRARRLPRRGRRQLDRVRPPGQGPRRVPAQLARLAPVDVRRHAGR